MSDSLIDKLMRHRRLEKIRPHTPGAASPQIIDFPIFHLAVFTLQGQCWYLNDTNHSYILKHLEFHGNANMFATFEISADECAEAPQ